MNKLLQFEQFHREDALCKEALFSMALLYCDGSNSMKEEVLFAKLDGNGDGQISTNLFKRLVRTLVFISAVLVPAVSNDHSNVLAEDFDNPVEDLVEKVVLYIFDNQLVTTQPVFKKKIKLQAKMIFESALLRKEFAKLAQSEVTFS